MKIWLVEVGDAVWPSPKEHRHGVEVEASANDLIRWQEAERVYQSVQDEMRALMPPVRKTVRIGKADFGHDALLVGAEARHAVGLDGALVGYLHSFLRDGEMYYRFTDVNMEVRGGEFAGKDTFRDWVHKAFG